MRRHRHEGQGGLTGDVVCHSSCLPQYDSLPSRLALWKGDRHARTHQGFSSTDYDRSDAWGETRVKTVWTLTVTMMTSRRLAGFSQPVGETML